VVAAAVLWVSPCFLSTTTLTTPPTSPRALPPPTVAVAEAVDAATACLPLLTTVMMVATAVVEEEGEVEEMGEGGEEEEGDEGEEAVETRKLTLPVARRACFQRQIGRVHRVGILIGLGVIRVICVMARNLLWPARAKRGRGWGEVLWKDRRGEQRP